MGYQSYIEGHATGENLVPQLLAQGFRLEEQWLRTAHGFLTGVLVIDDGRIEGTEQWHTSFGFEDLVEALHQVRDLHSVALVYHGEEGDMRGYRYHGGAWYTMITLRPFVREGELEQAQQALEAALAHFAPPGGGMS